MGSPSKACAVVIRSPDAIEVLAFEHPLAGFQLVKGTIEGGETPQQAAVRELREEAGFEARAVEDLGEWDWASPGSPDGWFSPLSFQTASG
jgi:8-oxo-dGTP pyrophosphatase MutT (NUDIX family)